MLTEMSLTWCPLLLKCLACGNEASLILIVWQCSSKQSTNLQFIASFTGSPAKSAFEWWVWTFLLFPPEDLNTNCTSKALYFYCQAAFCQNTSASSTSGHRDTVYLFASNQTYPLKGTQKCLRYIHSLLNQWKLNNEAIKTQIAHLSL